MLEKVGLQVGMPFSQVLRHEHLDPPPDQLFPAESEQGNNLIADKANVALAVDRQTYQAGSRSAFAVAAGGYAVNW